jgi:hypothetical protein
MDGPNGQYSNPATQKIQSTTATNGFLIFDADLSNPASPFENRTGSITSPAYDVVSTPNLLVYFEQSYRHCCTRDFFPKMELSTDDFTTVQTYNVEFPGISTNDQTGTIQTIVNIQPYLATATNLSNFKVRFTFEGSVGTSHYFWQIDDFKLIEQHQNDIAISNAWLGDILTNFEVTEAPTYFNDTLTVQASLKNYGFATPSNVTLNVKILNGSNQEVFNQSGGMLTNNFTLLFDTITYNTGFNISSLPVGTYSVILTIEMNGQDGNSTNNLFLRSFKVTDNTLSSINYDGNVFRNNIGYNYRDSQTNEMRPMTVGTLFYVPETEFPLNLKSVEIGLSIGPDNYLTTLGEPLIVNIWEYDPAASTLADALILISEDYQYTIEANHLNSDGSLFTFNLNQAVDSSDVPLQITGGKYYFVSFYHNGGIDKYLWYWTSFLDEDFSSFVNGPFGVNSAVNWFTAGYDPLIKMNFEQVLDAKVNEISNENVVFNVHPNPSKENATLSYNLKENARVKIEITDLTGKVLESIPVQNKLKGNNSTKIETTNYENGVYFVKLTINNSTSSKKLLISK